MLTLSNGVLVGIPVREIHYLAKATPAQLKMVELTPVGSGVSWPTLEVDLSVPGLLTYAFGRDALLQGLAHLGGKAKSPAKAEAARANGAKGGWPRKKTAA